MTATTNARARRRRVDKARLGYGAFANVTSLYALLDSIDAENERAARAMASTANRIMTATVKES